MAWKPTIAVDFDGVIHSYTSGWKGPTTIFDGPTVGALQWLIETSEHFVLAVNSSRNKEGPEAVAAMKTWLVDHLVKAKLKKRPDAVAFVGTLQFPVGKPSANMYIDDRGFQFTGRWPTVEEMRSFKPQRGVKAEKRLSPEAIAFSGVAKDVLVLLNQMHEDGDGCELNGADHITCLACQAQRRLVDVARF